MKIDIKIEANGETVEGIKALVVVLVNAGMVISKGQANEIAMAHAAFDNHSMTECWRMLAAWFVWHGKCEMTDDLAARIVAELGGLA